MPFALIDLLVGLIFGAIISLVIYFIFSLVISELVSFGLILMSDNGSNPSSPSSEGGSNGSSSGGSSGGGQSPAGGDLGGGSSNEREEAMPNLAPSVCDHNGYTGNFPNRGINLGCHGNVESHVEGRPLIMHSIFIRNNTGVVCLNCFSVFCRDCALDRGILPEDQPGGRATLPP